MNARIFARFVPRTMVQSRRLFSSFPSMTQPARFSCVQQSMTVGPASCSVAPCRFYGAAAGAPSEQDITDRVIQVVRNFDKVTADKVSAQAHFLNDLGLDSLDAVEIVMAIEDEFSIEIPDADADNIASIPDAIEYLKKTLA